MVSFGPGGLKVLSEDAFVSYQLPVTLNEGEFSAIVTGLTVTNDGSKHKLFTMRADDAAFNDNLYRMSVEVDGNGVIAWRFLTGPGPYIQIGPGERVPYNFHEDLTYFVQATWVANFFRVRFWEGGVNGALVYDFGKPYTGTYKPRPHNLFIGLPYRPGDRGGPDSYKGMTIRQIWVSANPRPDYANK
jgi:hypothetical protein